MLKERAEGLELKYFMYVKHHNNILARAFLRVHAL